MKKSFLEKAKSKVQESLGQDAYAIQAVRSLEDLDETNALVFQRLEEWYKIHDPGFPLTGEEAAYYIAHLDDESALLKKWPGEKLAHLREKQKSGFGADLSGKDKDAVMRLARQLWENYETRKSLEIYVRAVAEHIMPNTCVLIDGVLAARLLAIVGSLEKLALFPASTLQVLGAEKALFKHLRKGTLPPKHGLIFQSPYVNGVAFDKRGKAARALAGKLAIALKADRYTKHKIGEKLKEDLERRMSQIANLPTRNIQQIDYRDFAQKRFERRGPPRGNFRERSFDRPARSGGFGGPSRERSFDGPRRDFQQSSRPSFYPDSRPSREGPRLANREAPRDSFSDRPRHDGPRMTFKDRQRREGGFSRPDGNRGSFSSDRPRPQAGFRKKPWQKKRQ